MNKKWTFKIQNKSSNYENLIIKKFTIILSTQNINKSNISFKKQKILLIYTITRNCNLWKVNNI